MTVISLGTLVAAATGTDATTHTTASFAPTAANNFVFIVNHHTATAATPMNAPTGACIANMFHLQSLPISATRSQDIWVGRTTASAAAIVFHYNETATGAIWTIQEFLNVDLNRGVSNTIPGPAANQAQNSGIGTTFSNPLTYHIQNAANALVAVWGSDDSGGNNVTGEAGWTEVDDQSLGGAPTIAQSVYWRIGEDLTPTATIGASVAWVGYAIELWGKDASGVWSASETFTKADGANWGNDQPWTTLEGSPAVLSNQGTGPTANVANAILANDSSSANHEARVTISQMSLSVNSIAGLRLRSTSQNVNDYEFVRGGAASLSNFTVTLRKRIGSTFTNLGSTPIVVPRAGLTTSEDLYMTVVGSTITCYLNGVQVAAATDTTLAVQNRGGITLRSGLANQDTIVDNFSFGDIGKTRPPVTLAGKAATSSSAKAQHTKRWTSLAKSATADQAFATLSSRIARLRARAGTASNARATTFSSQVEGFSVARKLLAKGATASSAKAALTANQKKFATKLPITSAGGGVFNPAVLDVKKGQQGSSIPAVSSAKATLIRSVGETAKAFQSSSVTANITGPKTRFAATAATSSSAFAYLPSHVTFHTKLPNSTGAFSLPWDTPPGMGGFFICPNNDSECPTTLAHRSPGDRLFRHYRPRPVGRNVYIYSDGTVSESDPDFYTTMWREADRTSDTLPDAKTVVRIFWGGHEGSQVTVAEATLLVNAGYTVRGFHL